MKYSVGTKVCIKKTKAIGTIISIAEYISMYRVDTGTRCVWVDDSEIEEVGENDRRTDNQGTCETHRPS